MVFTYSLLTCLQIPIVNVYFIFTSIDEVTWVFLFTLLDEQVGIVGGVKEKEGKNRIKTKK